MAWSFGLPRASSIAVATACELSRAGRDSFVAGEGVEGGHRVFVEAVGVGDAAGVFPVAVFGADAGVVEAGGHRVDVARLAVVVLHHVAVAAVEDAGLAVAERGGVVAGFRAAAAGFDADERDLFVLDERIEHAGRVAAAADAGDDRIRQAAELLARLLDGFAADDRLEIADDPRERMRADDGAEDVVRRLDARHPVAHRFVDGVAERARAAGDGAHFGAEQLHAEDVRRLAANVFFAHVDDAVEAEVGTGGGGRDAVLAGAGFGDHALLAHPQREQRLADACC